jgi:hypothetical protein
VCVCVCVCVCECDEGSGIIPRSPFPNLTNVIHVLPMYKSFHYKIQFNTHTHTHTHTQPRSTSKNMKRTNSQDLSPDTSMSFKRQARRPSQQSLPRSQQSGLSLTSWCENLYSMIGEFLSYEDLVALSLTCIALDHDIMRLYMAYAGIAWHLSMVRGLRRQKQKLVRHVFLEHHLPTADDVWFQKVTHVTCGPSFKVMFRRGSLPSTLTHLTLGIAFNQPLPPGVLPPNIQELVFGLHFNQPIVQGCLPPGLRKLVFGHSFNKRLDAGVFPTSLECLQFGSSYNHPVPVGLLTPPLQHLVFGDGFNQPLAIASVPRGLRQLSFGASFKQSLQHVLPASLLQLTLGDVTVGLQHINN